MSLKNFFTMKLFPFLLINSIINRVMHFSTSITNDITELFIDNMYLRFPNDTHIHEGSYSHYEISMFQI